MTKEEARKILEESEEIAGWTDDAGILWHYKVGGFYKEYPEGFCFAVYPYNASKPIDPKFAFKYIVYSDNGEIDSSTLPLTKEELSNLEAD